MWPISSTAPSPVRAVPGTIVVPVPRGRPCTRSAWKRLFHSIKQAIDSYRPAAVFVYNTCVPALIGDDIEAVCKSAEQRWGTPVVPVDAAGFYGTKNLGNRIAGETMIKYVIGRREPDPLPENSSATG